MLEMAANDPMEHVQLTIQDMPEVERAAKCALPIIFTSLDHPEYPGVHGTCTALRFGADSIFVTAAHVVANSDDRTMVEVALGFDGIGRDPTTPRPESIEQDGPGLLIGIGAFWGRSRLVRLRVTDKHGRSHDCEMKASIHQVHSRRQDFEAGGTSAASKRTADSECLIRRQLTRRP